MHNHSKYQIFVGVIFFCVSDFVWEKKREREEEFELQNLKMARK